MLNISVKWQLFLVIALTLVSIFISVSTDRFLKNQEESQIKFNQKSIAQRTLETIVPTVEAQSPQRFEFLAVGEWTREGRSNRGTLGTITFQVAAVCDTANGNLLYLTGSSQSGPAVVPNGCTKNPR